MLHSHFKIFLDIPVVITPENLKCIAVLPGIGSYETSDSDSSEASLGSNENNEHFDLCGRPII